MESEFVVGGAELLEDVEYLWGKLLAYHKALSPLNPKRLADSNFAARKQGFIGKTARCKLRAELVKQKTDHGFIGYCVSTIVNEMTGNEQMTGNEEMTGKIYSIFVEEEYSGADIAEQLIKNALEWMDAERVEQKIIVVLAGNEDVHVFYRRFGFSL